VRSGKAGLASFEAASASEASAWARELLSRARRAAVRARIRAVTAHPAVRAAAFGLLVGALAASLWWATDLLAQL
jgi:hypothetical protein